MGKIEGGGPTQPPGGPEKPTDLQPGKTFMSLQPPQNIPANLGKLKQEYPEFYNKLMTALITGIGMKIVQDLQKSEKKREEAAKQG
ncbi:MAG: hypothetical protein AB7F31_05465 [Parachlamydiales bacterium]